MLTGSAHTNPVMPATAPKYTVEIIAGKIPPSLTSKPLGAVNKNRRFIFPIPFITTKESTKSTAAAVTAVLAIKKMGITVDFLCCFGCCIIVFYP